LVFVSLSWLVRPRAGEIVPQPGGEGFAPGFAVYTTSTQPGATTPAGFWHTEVLALPAR